MWGKRETEDPDRLRELMVSRQLEPRSIRDPEVLRAFREVPRHLFIPDVGLREAYGDHPVPIGKGQTISQPYIVALMTQALRLTGKEKVLEVGTGSGYQAAILALLAGTVYSLERIPQLAVQAGKVLEELGYANVIIEMGDGTLGRPENAPYDGIVVTAASPDVPPPLLEQLAEGGRLVIPVGSRFSQNLAVLEKKGGEIVRRDVCGCVFVPLIGDHGWKR